MRHVRIKVAMYEVEDLIHDVKADDLPIAVSEALITAEELSRLARHLEGELISSRLADVGWALADALNESWNTYRKASMDAADKKL